MKVFKFWDSVYLHINPEQIGILYCAGGEAGSYIYDERILLEDYRENSSLSYFYRIGGKSYRKSIVGNEEVYVASSGEHLTLPREFLETLWSYPTINESRFYVSHLENVPKKFKTSLAIFDLDEKSYTHIPINAYMCSLINDYVYGLECKKNIFHKWDVKLNDIWVFSPSEKTTSYLNPIIHRDIVLCFLGPEKEEKNLVDGHAKYTCSGGKLYGLNDSDGTVAWQLDMPNSMDGYELVDDTLYAVSLNEILLINPETGDIKHTIDTKTSTPFNRDLKPTITIDDKFIYYTHYDDAVILVYDVNTFEQVRRIDMPKGYYPKEHNFHDVNTGKQYFTIHNKTQYVAQWPVLEIDPNDIDSPVEFEAEPEIRIELLPAKGNDQEIEVVIKLQSESLDDALRFGEIYTRDEAQRYSHNYMNMTFMDRPFAPEKRFNGIVRFIYSGSKEDEIKVKEHLEIMEKRFQNWNEKEGFFACTNKKQPTRLIAEYVGGGGIRSL